MLNQIKRYGFFGFIYLVYCKVITLIIMPNAKIIRLPIDLRNKHLMKIGHGFTTGKNCRLEVENLDNAIEIKLTIGNNVQMNDNVHITASRSVRIGDNVLLASKIYISDCSHGSYSGNENDSNPETIPSERPLFSKSVVIEDNVWIGEFVSVLPGVTIGKGSIIGANSVVNKSLPPYVIAVGAPAKPIKRYNFEIGKWENLK